MIKECPNGCYVTDNEDKFRCPRCDKILLKHAKNYTKEQAMKDVEDRQNSYRKDLKSN